MIEEIYRYPTFYGIKYLKDGIPIIKGESIEKTGFIKPLDKNYDFIDKETHKKFNKTHIYKNDLIFTVRGFVGKVGYFEWDQEANINANVIKIRINKNAYSKYIWIFLNSNLGQKLIEEKSTGAAQQTITVPNIKSIKIPLPPLLKQKQIVAKIETMRAEIKANQEEPKRHLKKLRGRLKSEFWGSKF